MASTAATATGMPPGKPLKARVGRDDIVMRGFMLVIALYLIVTLALPLFAMLSKAFSTYRFDLGGYELQVSDETGEFLAAPVTALALNAKWAPSPRRILPPPPMAVWR